jgi:tetratricopeptide (TPR) repeat protein
MICPMLSALKPVDDHGNPVNRECIYEECRFFDQQLRDCSLMVASQAMLDLSRRGAPAPAADAGTGEEMDRRLNAIRKDLLTSALEVQGVVREAAQAILERLASGVPAASSGPAASRPDAAASQELQALHQRLGSIERTVAGSSVALHRSLEEGLLAFSARLDTKAQGMSNSDAVVAQLLAQINALAQTQQKAVGRLLEEMAAAQASARRIDQAVAALEKGIARTTEDSLQVQQLLTLVKGQTEKTHAALRSITEGNRTVLQAIETQAQRDQADLGRRRQEEAEACNSRGVLLYYRGALEGSLQAFDRALELAPGFAEAHNNRGLVLSRLGRSDEAVTAFEEALRLDPGMGEVFNNLGFLYHARNEHEKAVEMFNQAVQGAGDSSIAYTNLGNSFYRLNQPEKAVSAWRHALELDPMNENARRGLRMFQQDAGSN